MRKYVAGVVACLLMGGVVMAQKIAALPPGLDAYINKVMQTFQVPGMAISIVRDGKVLLAKGYGVKKLGENNPVDNNTLFLIASNSKAFTATSLAMLVEEKKLTWEEPVVNILPWFRMSDPYITMNLTVRDLLVHQSGLRAYAGDVMLFPPSLYSRRQILEKLPLLPMAHPFRTDYAYDNVLYLAAGEVVQAIAGISPEDFIKTRIFDKVGMNESIARFSLLKTKTNVAVAHNRNAGSIRPVDNFVDLAIGDASDPAGGIVSTASDMANWLITQLDSGRTPLQNRIFQPATTRELWKMVRPMPIDQVPAALKPSQQDFWGYCLGFRSYNYGKYKVIGHGGALKGFVSQVIMIPDLKLGVSVLTNQTSTGAYWSILYHVMDYYMQNKTFDWLGGYKSILDSSLARNSVRRKNYVIKKDSLDKPSLPLEKYAGTFNEPLIGNITIKKEDSGLVMRFSNSLTFVADLEYFQYNNFTAHFRNNGQNADAAVQFTLRPDGNVDHITMKVTDPESSIYFDDMLLTPAVFPKIHDTTALRAAISTEFAKFPAAHFAFALKDLATGKTFFMNEHDSFHAASTMKTPVLIETYKQAAAGKLSLSDPILVKNTFTSIVDDSSFSMDSLDDSEHELYRIIGSKVPVSDLLFRMITKSSNLSTNIIIDLVGAKNVMATMKSIGADQMKVLRGVEDDKAFDLGMNNTTNAYDLMLVFEQLAAGKLVSKAASDSMINILMAQYFRNIIPAKLPAGVKTATKSGGLPGICHDSGIVFLPDGRKYVVVLLSNGIPDHEVATDLLSTVSRYMYDYLK